MSAQHETITRILREQKEAERVIELRAKLENGSSLNKQELADFEKYEKGLLEKFGMRFMANCPRKVYNVETGRAPRAINRHADVYDIPIRGDIVDIWAVLTRMHDILTENAVRLRSNPEYADGHEPGFRSRLEEEKWQKLVDEREVRQQNLVSRQLVHETMQQWSSILQRCAGRLRKRYDNEAGDMLEDAIEDMTMVINSALGEPDDRSTKKKSKRKAKRKSA